MCLSAFQLCEMNFVIPAYPVMSEFQIPSFLCDCDYSINVVNPVSIRPKSEIEEGKENEASVAEL